ncbi:MAG: hypothetical protein ACLQBX_06750 [Candidatus Limnocylindrales bacterium]
MQQASGTVLKIVRPSPMGDVVVATTADAKIVGLVAALVLDAQRGRPERDPILSDLRAGQQRALRRLASAG